MIDNPIKLLTLKAMLDRFCLPREREFSITYSKRKTKWRRGVYLPKRKLIILYLHHYRDSLDLIANALHEFSHHITRQRYGNVRPHGREFRKSFEEIVGAFNTAYWKHLNGGFLIAKHLTFDSVTFRCYREITPPGEYITEKGG